MFGLPPQIGKRKKAEIVDVETVLESSLKPVSPRPEFIKSLHRGLMDHTFLQVETSGSDIKKTLIFALLGFTGIVLFMSLWIRLIMIIISTLGMIQTSKQEREAD